jgi:hypothetical protein
MEIEGVHLVYAFIVTWNDLSRGIFLTEYFTTLETCMTHLQSWTYDPNHVSLECIAVVPD